MSLLAKLGSNLPEDCADFMFDNRDIYEEFKNLIDHEDSFEMIEYNTLKIDEVWKSCNDKRDFNIALQCKIDEIYNVDSFIIDYTLPHRLYDNRVWFNQIILSDMKFDTFVPDNNQWPQVGWGMVPFEEDSPSLILKYGGQPNSKTPYYNNALNIYKGINLDKYIEIAQKYGDIKKYDSSKIGFIIWSLNYLPKYIYKYLSKYKPDEKSYRYFYHDQYYVHTKITDDAIKCYPGYHCRETFKTEWASFEGDRPPTLGKLKEMLGIEHIGRFEPNGKCTKVAR